MPGWVVSRDIVAPRVRDGVLQYVAMELIPPAEAGENWTLRHKVSAAPPAVPVASVAPEAAGLVSYKVFLMSELSLKKEGQSRRLDQESGLEDAKARTLYCRPLYLGRPWWYSMLFVCVIFRYGVMQESRWDWAPVAKPDPVRARLYVCSYVSDSG